MTARMMKCPAEHLRHSSYSKLGILNVIYKITSSRWQVCLDVDKQTNMCVRYSEVKTRHAAEEIAKR